MPRRELPLQKRIVDAINRAGGTARVRAQTEWTVVGDPDVYGSWRGLHFEFEVKEEGEKPTDIQKLRISQWKQSGAIAGVVRSVDQAMQALRDRAV